MALKAEKANAAKHQIGEDHCQAKCWLYSRGPANVRLDADQTDCQLDLIIVFLRNHILLSHNRQINNTTGVQPKDQLARKIAVRAGINMQSLAVPNGHRLAPAPRTLRNSRRLTPLPQLQLQPQDSSLGLFVFDFIEDLLLSLSSSPFLLSLFHRAPNILQIGFPPTTKLQY